MSNALKTRTNINAGGISAQHSEANTLRVRTFKAGRLTMNQSQARGLRVRSGVKAGGVLIEF